MRLVVAAIVRQEELGLTELCKAPFSPTPAASQASARHTKKKSAMSTCEKESAEQSAEQRHQPSISVHNVVQYGIMHCCSTAQSTVHKFPLPTSSCERPVATRAVSDSGLKPKHSQHCDASKSPCLCCAARSGSCRAQAWGGCHAPVTLSSTSLADFRAPPSAASCSETDVLGQGRPRWWPFGTRAYKTC